MSGSENETSSHRAVEAFESIPGDSEAAVDYPPAMVGLQAIPDSLSVDITIYLPDGGHMSFSESAPADRDEYDFEHVEELLEGVLKSVRARIS